MNQDFSSLYNYHEREVLTAVMKAADDYPEIKADSDLMCDVACVALNRLPPRYIRHAVDFLFYLTEHERSEIDNAILDAVNYAFIFVQARTTLRANA